ncbi:MAG: hypothetical protein K2Q03_10485 [Sphingobacteriaceae bacterium]|nr:hypothetical protein [Sphingobacteriaceae bacterium]
MMVSFGVLFCAVIIIATRSKFHYYCYYSNDAKTAKYSKYQLNQTISKVLDGSNSVSNMVDTDYFTSIQYTFLPFIFCGFPTRKNHYRHVEINQQNNTLYTTFSSEYMFHINSVSYSFACDPNYPVYGIYPYRILNWFATEVKRKRIYHKQLRLTDKYEFIANVLGLAHPSAKDLDAINDCFRALSLVKVSAKFGSEEFNDVSIFANNNVDWLWSDSSLWQYSIELNEDFLKLIRKSCPVSQKGQYDLFGSELILFNYFMYQNYCLNSRNRTYTFDYNLLMDLLNMPVIGSSQLKNNKQRIIELSERISNKTGLKLMPTQYGILIEPNEESLLVQPIKSVKTTDGRTILTHKETNIFLKKHTDWDIARAMYCVQYRINTKEKEVKDPIKYIAWHLKQKDDKAKRSMQKAGIALGKASFVKFRNINSKSNDKNSLQYSELIEAVNILQPNNKPLLNQLAPELHQSCKEIYKWMGNQVHFYNRDGRKHIEGIEPYIYAAWVYITNQVPPPTYISMIHAISVIPEIQKLKDKYKSDVQVNIDAFDLSDILFDKNFIRDML